jgi:hypothetical protein
MIVFMEPTIKSHHQQDRHQNGIKYVVLKGLPGQVGQGVHLHQKL